MNTAASDGPRFAIDNRGEAWASIVFTVMLAGPFALAVYNLVHLQAIFYSGIWVGIHALVIGLMLWEDGLAVTLRSILGVFSWRHFLELAEEGKDRVIRVGFVSVGRSFITHQIPADTIRLVEVGWGQASDMTGKDENDWGVSLWFGSDTPHSPISQLGRHPGLAIYCLPESTTKARAIARAQEFLAFLAQAGVQMREFTEPDTDVAEGSGGGTSNEKDPALRRISYRQEANPKAM